MQPYFVFINEPVIPSVMIASEGLPMGNHVCIRFRYAQIQDPGASPDQPVWPIVGKWQMNEECPLHVMQPSNIPSDDQA